MKMQNKDKSTCLKNTKTALSSRGSQNAVLKIVKFFGGLRSFIVRSGKFPVESVTNPGWNDTIGGCLLMLCYTYFKWYRIPPVKGVRILSDKVPPFWGNRK